MLVNGSPDEIAETPLSPWWQVSGGTGTLVQVADSSGVGGTQTNDYRDDAAVDPLDTGDGRCYGDTGIKVVSPNQTVDYQTALYVLPPGLPNVGEVYAAYAAYPLQVTAIVPTALDHHIFLPLVLRN